MATYAQQPQDENLVSGWNVQGNYSSTLQETFGIPGSGYAEPGAAGVPTVTEGNNTQNLPGSGYPYPPGAMDVGAEESGSYGVPILQNPGYADGSTLIGAEAALPVPTTTGVQQPFGVSTMAAIVVPDTVTAISVAPFVSSTVLSPATPVYTVVWSGTATAAEEITVTVPAAGFVKMTGANATSVTYTALGL